MTTNQEVIDIAGRLGSSQREVLMRLGRTPRRATDFSGSTAAALRLPNRHRPALTDRNITRDHGRRTARYFLTAAGLAVRTHLRAEATNEQR